MKKYLFLVIFLVSGNLFTQNFTFDAAPSIAVYNGQVAIAADLNKDNAPDLILSSNLPDLIHIYLNDGEGNFAAQPDSTYPVGDYPRDIAVGDLDLDTNIDIITANNSDSTISILFGNGDGTIRAIEQIKLGQQVTKYVGVGQLDTDEFPDIAVSTGTQARLYIISGNGDGTFKIPVDYPAGVSSPHDVVIGDFDLDQDMDIALGNGGAAYSVIHYNNEGDFSTTSNLNTMRPPTHPVAMNINDDLLLDFVIASNSYSTETLEILLNDGQDSYVRSALVTPGSYLLDLEVTDFNSDGFWDALTIDKYGMYISRIDGASAVAGTDTITSFENQDVKTIYISDFNKDQKMDILVCRIEALDIYLNTTAPVSIDKISTIPLKFKLSQNYPNPFNPTTTIEYSLSKSDFVTLKVYNILGSEVATLIQKIQPAGTHKINWDASGLSSGVYYYEIKAGESSQIKKMVLLR
jgi:hypothetical protein